jgi:hypothetical protein
MQAASIQWSSVHGSEIAPSWPLKDTSFAPLPRRPRIAASAFCSFATVSGQNRQRIVAHPAIILAELMWRCEIVIRFDIMRGSNSHES